MTSRAALTISEIVISVMHHVGGLRKDSLIGQVRLNISQLSTEPPIAKWYRLNPRLGKVDKEGRPPRGELSVEVQARFAAALQRLHAERPAARVAIVSHGDTIRYAMAFFLGLALDLSLRLQLDPASVCAVAWGDVLHPAGEFEVQGGDGTAHAVRVHGEGDRVVAEGEVGVVVQLVLDPGDVQDERGGCEVRVETVAAGEPVAVQRPAGQLGQPVLDLLLRQRCDGHGAASFPQVPGGVRGFSLPRPAPAGAPASRGAPAPHPPRLRSSA